MLSDMFNTLSMFLGTGGAVYVSTFVYIAILSVGFNYVFKLLRLHF